MYTLEFHCGDATHSRKYGIFTTLAKAQDFVKNALGAEVDWSDPKRTVKGTSTSNRVAGVLHYDPRRVGFFMIDRFAVDPAEFSNDLRYGLVD